MVTKGKIGRQTLTEGPIVRSLLTLSIPIVMANILQTAYQLTDTFWVGRLGAGAVAAVSVSFPVIFLLISVGGGLAVAGSILVSQYAGARNERMVNHVSAQTILMVATASLVLSLTGYLIAPLVIGSMGVAPEILLNATRYLRISFLGLVFLFCYAMFQSIMRGIGEVRLPLYIVLSTVFLNLVLDPMFIFGWGPLPAAGVAGAAYATVCTQGLSALIGLVVLFGGRFGFHLKLADFAPDLPIMKKTVRLGLPASIEQSTRALGLMVMTFLVSSFGTLTIAAYGIGTRVLSFVIIPALGLSMASATLVGQNIGAGNAKRASDIARLAAWLGFWVLSAVGVAAFLFAVPLVRFFVPADPGVIRAGARFVRTMALTFGLIGVQMALAGAFRGSGNTLVTMLLALLSLWVLQFPSAYLLSKHTALGADGLWWAFPFANVVTAAFCVGWFARGTWKNKRLTEDAQLKEDVSEEIIIEEGLNQ